MNFPNLLTVLRTIMSLVTAVLLCFEPAGLPTFTFFFFVAAGATDWLDGYIARKNNIVTVFGKFMDALSDKIEFAYDTRYGYLTSCPTNVGTGMRASVMLFLPALTMTRKITAVIHAVSRERITVREVLEM